MSATTRSCTLLGEVTTAGLHAGQGDPRPLLLDLAKLCRRVPTILCTSSRIHNERRFRSSFGGLGFGGSSVLPRLGVAPRFFAHALTLGLTTSNCTVHVARRVARSRNATTRRVCFGHGKPSSVVQGPCQGQGGSLHNPHATHTAPSKQRIGPVRDPNNQNKGGRWDVIGVRCGSRTGSNTTTRATHARGSAGGTRDAQGRPR